MEANVAVAPKTRGQILQLTPQHLITASSKPALRHRSRQADQTASPALTE